MDPSCPYVVGSPAKTICDKTGIETAFGGAKRSCKLAFATVLRGWVTTPATYCSAIWKSVAVDIHDRRLKVHP